MLAQRLRHRITIQEQIEQNSVSGEYLGVVWGNLLTDLPAEMVPLSGREYIAASAEQAEISVRCTIRYTPGILPKQRVLFDGLAYDIQAVLPDPTARKHLTLMLSAGVRYEVAEAATILDGGDAATVNDDFLDGGGA